MTYEFSFASFFIGLIILGLGVAFVRWHRVIADNFGAGVGSYERYKTYAFITCAVGLIVMINLHVMLLGWVVSLLFNR